jgi:hypothetical protein
MASSFFVEKVGAVDLQGEGSEKLLNEGLYVQRCRNCSLAVERHEVVAGQRERRMV